MMDQITNYLQEQFSAMIELTKKIINGDIAVGTAFDMSTEDVAALRDGMKP